MRYPHSCMSLPATKWENIDIIYFILLLNSLFSYIGLLRHVTRKQKCGEKLQHHGWGIPRCLGEWGQVGDIDNTSIFVARFFLGFSNVVPIFWRSEIFLFYIWGRPLMTRDVTQFWTFFNPPPSLHNVFLLLSPCTTITKSLTPFTLRPWCHLWTTLLLYFPKIHHQWSGALRRIPVHGEGLHSKRKSEQSGRHELSSNLRKWVRLLES